MKQTKRAALIAEVKKTVEWLAKTDLKIFGHVTGHTREAAKRQKVNLKKFQK